MKRLNQILFLSSFAIVSGAFGMEKGDVKEWLVEFNNKVVKDLIGNNMRYGEEYCSTNGDNGTVSFPLEKLINLPSIEHCGRTRFFTTSATARSLGKVYKFTNHIMLAPIYGFTSKGNIVFNAEQDAISKKFPKPVVHESPITQLAIVRGFNPQNNRCVNVYVGFTDNKRINGRQILYSADVVALQAEDRSCSANGYSECTYSKSYVEPFTAQDLEMEVRKCLPKGEDCDWNNLVTYKVVRELLGERDRDFNPEDRRFYPRENYLDKENGLKGITYHSDRK